MSATLGEGLLSALIDLREGARGAARDAAMTVVYAAARTLVRASGDEADELIQDVVLALHVRCEFDGATPGAAVRWLQVVLDRRRIDVWRRRSRHVEVALDDVHETPNASPEDRTAHAEDAEQVAAVVTKLREVSRGTRGGNAIERWLEHRLQIEALRAPTPSLYSDRRRGRTYLNAVVEKMVDEGALRGDEITIARALCQKLTMADDLRDGGETS